MSITHLVAVFSVVISTAFLKLATGNNKLIFLHFALLFATPWLFILLLGNPLHSPSSFSCNSSSKNFSCLISAEYIAFEGEQNIHHKVGDYQLLLPSFIPLVLTGIYNTLSGKNNKQKLLLVVIPAIILLGFLNLDKSFFVILSFVIVLSSLATLGTAAIITNFKKLPLLLKTLTAFELLWILYEALRMYQIIIVNKPFITS